MTEGSGFEELYERVIIEWGKAGLAWHQWWNENNDKEIIEITAGLEHQFPGYDNLSLSLAQMKNIIIEKEYPEWKRMLSAVNCIYVIADDNSGKIYVGSTYNREGIWKRWKEYAQTGGHGGNRMLESIYEKESSYPMRHFTWSILEILPIGISSNEAITIETRYKNKLGRAACALNCN